MAARIVVERAGTFCVSVNGNHWWPSVECLVACIVERDGTERFVSRRVGIFGCQRKSLVVVSAIHAKDTRERYTRKIRAKDRRERSLVGGFTRKIQ